MKRILLFIVFAGFTLTSLAQFRNPDWQNPNRRRVPSLTVGFDVASPTGQFRDRFDGTPVGIGGQFFSNLGRSPIELGFGFSWLSRGTMNEDIWIYEGTDIDGDEVFSEGRMSINSNIYTYNGAVRLKPFAGRIQPYGDLLAGVRNFSTVTVVRPDESDDAETRDRQHRDFTYTYGWAAGLKVRVTPILFVEARFANLYGGGVDFIDRETIIVSEEGILDYELSNSRTDMQIFQVGISFEF